MEQRQHIIDAHRQIVLQLRQIEDEISAMLAASDPHWMKLEEKRSQLLDQVEPLIEQYWQWVPSIVLSKCPYCKETLSRRFDKVDLNGFWWMDRTQRFPRETGACEHFCLLSGAIDLKGQKVSGGLFECRPGPDKPFVIPRILEMPSMVAVIGEIPMECGYSAYPIAYFSKVPPQSRALTQSWARKEYYFTLPDGRSGWDITTEKQDFDLREWVKLNKIFIFRNGDLGFLKEGDPILKIKNTGRGQIILDNTLSYESFINH